MDKKKRSYASSATIYAVFAIGALVLLNLIGTRVFGRLDLTQNKSNASAMFFAAPGSDVARVPVADVEIADCSISAFTPTLVLLAAANRDPRRFSEPDRFDAHRDEGAPLSFAVGSHHCLGASLARMEAEVMLAAVTRRWPRLTLAGPAPRWWSSGPFRGLNHLRVRVSEARP